MRTSKKQSARGSSGRYLRLMPGIYSSVVVGSTLAGYRIQSSAESLICGIAVLALVAGFVAVAGRIGLWGWHEQEPSASRSESESALSRSLCRSSC